MFISRHVKFGEILPLPKTHLSFVNLPLGPLTCCLFVVIFEDPARPRYDNMFTGYSIGY